MLVAEELRGVDIDLVVRETGPENADVWIVGSRVLARDRRLVPVPAVDLEIVAQIDPVEAERGVADARVDRARLCPHAEAVAEPLTERDGEEIVDVEPV